MGIKIVLVLKTKSSVLETAIRVLGRNRRIGVLKTKIRVQRRRLFRGLSTKLGVLKTKIGVLETKGWRFEGKLVLGHTQGRFVGAAAGQCSETQVVVSSSCGEW